MNLIFLLGIALSLVTGVLDYLTGPDLAFSIFYLIPLLILTWFIGPKRGYALAAVDGLVSWYADFLFEHEASHTFALYWNSVVRLVVLLAAVALVSHIRNLYLRQSALIADLNRALAEIKRLGGLIPICSWCKKVREDTGYWKQVEEFVRDHSEAEFTHGICPDCEARLETS